MSLPSGQTRREFLKGCAVAAIASGAIPVRLGKDHVQPTPLHAARSKVVIARDASLYGESLAPDSSRVQKLLDRAMQNFAESSDPVEPWRRLIRPHEVVGLKVNSISGIALSTHVVLVEAICERLQQAGIKPGNIIVWDRSNSHLEYAGYTLADDPNHVRVIGTDSKRVGYDDTLYAFGVVKSRLSNLLTRTCDCMINVPILKHHSNAGVTAALKNMYGVNDNPSELHANNCCPAVADLNMLSPIREKFRFVVTDAMTASFEGGPNFFPKCAWKYNGILVSPDPVAIDYTGWQIIERRRAEHGLGTLTAVGAAPNYIAVAADPEHRIGNDNPDHILVTEI